MESPPAKPAKNGCTTVFLGTIAYLILALDATHEDPFISFPFQIVTGLGLSLILMFLARLLGLLLRVEPFSEIWYWSRLLPATVIAAGITGVCYHKQLPAWASISAWFLVIFGTTHFWIKKPGQEREGESAPTGNESL